MAVRENRRGFLWQSALGAGALLQSAGWGRWLRPVSAAEASLPLHAVQFTPDIEPLVRLIEETSRERLMEAVAERIGAGTSYQEVLTALFLAGVRNVQPRPSVGFKFHAVLVVNSAHLASLASPDADRWLPILWALDNFKSSQARDVTEGNWTMAAVDESRVPSASQSVAQFHQAMESWDEELADVAAAGLTRSVGANQVLDLFTQYGVRDFRSIGHKAIFVANAWRTLQTIGWNHAEPIMRSLAYALLNHEGEPNPAQSDLAPDRPGRENVERCKSIRQDWLDGQPDPQATQEILTTLRSASPSDVAAAVVEMVNRGVAPQSIFDGYFAVASELLMRQTGIVALHAVTTVNAMHALYQATGIPSNRQLILLQTGSFLALFRESMNSRGQVGDARFDALVPADNIGTGTEVIGQIFDELGNSKSVAASQALAYLNNGGDAGELLQAARQLVFLKGNDAHDYKYSSAILEDCFHIRPELRNAYLAATLYNMRSSRENDNPLTQRIRAALS
jgi:hypothetical protein